MVLNRLPEFNTPTQTQCSRAFWYLRPPFEQTQKSSTMKFSIPTSKHLSQVVLKKKVFEYYSMYFSILFYFRAMLHIEFQELN